LRTSMMKLPSWSALLASCRSGTSSRIGLDFIAFSFWMSHGVRKKLMIRQRGSRGPFGT
jgi:hypothetical protein